MATNEGQAPDSDRGFKNLFKSELSKRLKDEPQFPDRVVNSERQGDEDYAARLRQFATDWVEFYIRFYKAKSKNSCKLALTLRWVAFTAMVFGGVILVGRMLSSNAQKAVMGFFNSTLQDIPAEAGLILFALAAGIIAADRFANVSDNWMRYVITELSLRRMLVDFQLAGVNSDKTAYERPENPELLNEPLNKNQAEFDRIKMFLGSVFDLVRHETQEWADEFRKKRSDLEGYLKVQEAEAKNEGRPRQVAGNPTKPS